MYCMTQHDNQIKIGNASYFGQGPQSRAETGFKYYSIIIIIGRRPNGLVGNHVHRLSAEVLSSILVKSIICVLSSVTGKKRDYASK